MPSIHTGSAAQNPDSVVTLVHGTWAKNAQWVKPNAVFFKSLRRALGPRADINAFQWTGKNSHKARHDAALELSEVLTQRVAQYPTARHYVIGHSHGGNIALHAVAHAGLDETVAGVVCMSTPFISARERDLGREPGKQAAGAAVVPGLLMAWWVDDMTLPDFGLGIPQALIHWLIVVMTLVGMGLLAVYWHGFVKRLLAELTVPKAVLQPSFADKVLIVRTPADEASATLSFVQFVSQLSVRVYMRAYSAYLVGAGFLERLSKRKPLVWLVIAAMLLAIVGALVMIGQLSAGFTSEHWSMKLLFGVIVAAFVALTGAALLAVNFVEGVTTMLMIAAAAVLWPVVLLLSLMLLPFGREIALANVLLDVTAESTPPGAWRVNLIEPTYSADLGKDMLPLRHSVVYEDPCALRLICDWLTGEKTLVLPSLTATRLLDL